VQVLEFIKNALLGWLSGFAHEVPGFHLLTVILGRNPFTDETVPRTAENLIRGFITLLPGGNAIYERLSETGTIATAAARIEGAVEALGISWDFIVGLFTDIWNSLSIADVVAPIETFTRIVARFGEPIGRLFAFVQVVLREMITIILEMMNFPSDLIGSIIANAMQAIEDIKRDPIAFLMNMLAAVKQGFTNFFDNIVTHLLGGLADWLFRALRQAGVEPPADLSLSSILDFVLRALGVTMENLWAKLAERIGQENVDRIRGALDRLVGVWGFVRDVQERGVVAIWEYIESQISNLWNMVLDKAREWIMERIINRAIQWLLSLLDATGIMPVINSFIAFFNAIQSAIEYLRDILGIINDYVSTMASIARGAIQPGAEKMERGLANAIPIAIGFLANQFGLSNIGERIAEIIAGLREMIDAGIDWLLDRAMGLWQSMLQALGLGGEEAAAGAEEVEGSPGDTSVQQPFSLSGASHTLRVVAQGSRVDFEMASNGFHSLDTEVGRIIALLEARRSAPGADPNLGRVIEYLREARSIFGNSTQHDWGQDPRRAPTYQDYLAMRANDVIQKLLVLQGWGVSELDDLLARFGRNSGCMAGPYSGMADPPIVAIGPDAHFLGWQISAIKSANMSGPPNPGEYMSDCPDQDTTEPIPSGEVEIDHIIPRARGGSNSFTNAQLVSGTFNRRKSDTVPSPCRCNV
jgi:hypothetical protein